MSFASERGERSRGLLWAALALLCVSVFFYYRQNVAGQIGGPISIPKLLWLDYALLAWFVVPFFFLRAPLLAPELRRIYGWHLACFGLRGVVELYMLYVSVGWRPAYGIAHDAFQIGLIGALLWRARAALLRLETPWDRAARRFLVSIVVGLLCEIAFAQLFDRVRAGRMDLYFASADPLFATTNALTAVAVAVGYPDLILVAWRAREALFPAAGHGRHEMRHAEG